jgi:3-oxoacyl-[acyl-carrier protein] reductase
MKTNQSKVAIITGSSRGIGAAIAKGLASDGLAVIVNYAGHAADAETVVQEIRAAGGRTVAVRADVSVAPEVAALFDKAEESFGGIDIIVNNAGIMQQGLVSVADTDDALFDRLFAINVKGTFNTLRLAATAAAPGWMHREFLNECRRTRAAWLHALRRHEVGGRNPDQYLRQGTPRPRNSVNAVAPGPTATELFFNGKTPEQIAHMSRMAPLERLGRPEDIAAVVSFLMGPDEAWVNGQTLRANGGIV